jgi:hypothetical protein
MGAGIHTPFGDAAMRLRRCTDVNHVRSFSRKHILESGEDGATAKARSKASCGTGIPICDSH